MASDSAVSRVFGVDELLESILIYLSIDRLLMLKRVSWEWNRVIAGSPSLQKILFIRPALGREVHEHNPLFEDYFKHIATTTTYDSTSDSDGIDLPPKISSAQLTISPNKMRRLLYSCPKSWREMTMFQPPCSYHLTMTSASIFDITVRFKNEANIPIHRAVEKANQIVELEAEKKRRARTFMDQTLRGSFARVAYHPGENSGSLLKQGESLKRRRG